MTENECCQNEVCPDDLFVQLGFLQWQFVNARSRHIRRVVTEQAMEERQVIWDRGSSEEEQLVVDTHNDDLVVIHHLDAVEMQPRQRRLLSDEPEDANRLGFIPEAE